MTQKLSRRDALKVLGAAAGATALANLPAKWTTPKLEAGVLPAHAQTSLCTDYALVVEIISKTGVVGLGVVQGLSPTSTSGTLGEAGYTLYWDCTPGCIVVAAATSTLTSMTVRFTVMGNALPDVNLSGQDSYAINLDTTSGAYAEGDSDYVPAAGNCPEYND